MVLELIYRCGNTRSLVMSFFRFFGIPEVLVGAINFGVAVITSVPFGLDACCVFYSLIFQSNDPISSSVRLATFPG